MQTELDLAKITEEEFEGMILDLISRRFPATRSVLLMVTYEALFDVAQKVHLIGAGAGDIDDEDGRRSCEDPHDQNLGDTSKAVLETSSSRSIEFLFD